jgi:RNA polymerase sigma factor (sigma-70 family)
MPIAEADPLPPDHDRIAAPSLVLDALYRGERRSLLKFVSHRADREHAEDIVQQVFLKVAAANDGPAITNPASYLRRAAQNLIHDTLRAAARRQEVCHVPLDHEPLAGPDLIAQVEARDRLRRIEEAVGRLKPLTRQIFLACRLDGYSYAEIAEQTGLSVRGVEKQMHRAIKQLGRHLRWHD